MLTHTTDPLPRPAGVRAPHARAHRQLAHQHARRATRAARRGTPAPQPQTEQTALATVAHEIRGPVTALATSSGLLIDDLELLEVNQVRGMVSAIHRRALYLQGLVENLLCAATIRAGGTLALQQRDLDLADLLEETRAVVEPLLAQRGQHLRLRVGGAVPEVRADGRRLGQVLVNLILNAGKFGRPGSRIDVTVSVRGGAVRVAVADRGPGLPAGQAERLFEPYYRAQSSESGSVEGIGLGLSIVKSIVEAHAGRVGAQPRRGGGARFWFDLPLPTSAPLSEPERNSP
jgi:two-component system, OmpR family, sensor histidine kinase KdpD